MGQREEKSTILLIQIITNLTKKNKNYTNTINKTLHKYKTFQCFFMCCNPNNCKFYCLNAICILLKKNCNKIIEKIWFKFIMICE